MNKGTYPIVIAIAGVSGGGKTTIVSHLNRSLQNAKTLFLMTTTSMVLMTL